MILNRIVNVALTERVTFEHNSVISEGIRHADLCRKRVLDRGNSSRKKALRRDTIPSEFKQSSVDRAVDGVQ